jgi:hypothetical protein
MKNIISIFFCVVFFTTQFLASAQQTPAPNSADLGLFNSPIGSNRFEIRLKPNQNLIGNSGFSACVLTVRFPSSYNVNLLSTNSPYGITSYQSIVNAGTRYVTFQFAGNPIPVTWNQNTEYLLVAFEHTNSGSGIGNFVLGNDAYTNANNLDYYIEFEGSDAQNNIYSAIAAAPLPVELIKFDVKKLSDNEIDLNWDAIERNFSHYQVEASRNEKDKFIEIGRVDGLNAGSAKSSYLFKDKNPVAGINYFRLKMIDKDGRFQYSNITSVNIEKQFDSSFEVFPNPSSGPITVSFDSENDKNVKMEIQNLEGRFVKTYEINATKGKNQIPMDIDLSNGVYNLVFRIDGKQETVKRLIITE